MSRILQYQISARFQSGAHTHSVFYDPPLPTPPGQLIPSPLREQLQASVQLVAFSYEASRLINSRLNAG